jgi:hypothetical protein
MDLNKMMKDKIMKVILVIIIIIIPTYIAFVYVSLSPGVNSRVSIDDELFFSKKVVNNVTTITITVYINNDGVGDSGELRLKVYVKDQDEISTSEGEKDIGTIEGKKTEPVKIDVVVTESERYTVITKLFEDDKEIIDSEGGFTAPTSSDKKESGGSFVPRMESDDESREDFSAPGYGAVELIVAVILILIVLNTRKYIKSNRKK